MKYQVKEIYYTLQGEGAHTGRPAVFLRFTGCNLWTGREEDRSNAVCNFCDTEFLGTNGQGGGEFESAQSLAKAVAQAWLGDASNNGTPPFVVCTGGEPLLQLDDNVIDALHDLGFQIAVETNGTRVAPANIDWICCSPKVGSELVLKSGHELKFVFPQGDKDPNDYAALNFEQFYLQPMDGPDRDKNTELAIDYCRKNPLWRLSMQTHKTLGLP